MSLNTQRTASPPNEYLVGAGDAPSFPTFGAAYNAFYHDSFVVSGTNNPPLGQLSIRFVDSRARIGRVRIRPTSLDVWVSGRALDGTQLELNGAEYRTTVDLTKGGRVSFPLPSDLPSDSWLWLKQGTEWHDFRALSWEGNRTPNVETELPRDPLAELSLLAAQGEGPHLEYKEKLPDSRDEKRNVFKTVVAFANGDGGTLLFGVGDGGELRGVKDKLAEGRRRLNDLLRDLVDPAPSVRPYRGASPGWVQRAGPRSPLGRRRALRAEARSQQARVLRPPGRHHLLRPPRRAGRGRPARSGGHRHPVVRPAVRTRPVVA